MRWTAMKRQTPFLALAFSCDAIA